MGAQPSPVDVEKQPLLNGRSESNAGSSLGSASNKKAETGLGPFANIAGLSTVTGLILYYAACSSTMLVINKVAVHYIPAPSFVLFCQLAISALVAQMGHAFGVWETDALEWPKVKKFLLVVVGFLGTVFCNIKVLQYSNVETFITFRSSTPLIVSLCDYLFLGRALPSLRSWVCLLFLLAGSAGYVMVDTAFDIRAYHWLAAWYVCFVFEAVYVKHMCESVKMTNWGRVFYTNLMSAPFLLIILFSASEQEKLSSMNWNMQMLFPLVLSCVVGVCMSHASYLLRDNVSATLFTVVGILCKIVTVIINFMIWDKHATLEGVAFLMLCVVAGTFYQQSPKRSEIKAHQIG